MRHVDESERLREAVDDLLAAGENVRAGAVKHDVPSLGSGHWVSESRMRALLVAMQELEDAREEIHD